MNDEDTIDVGADDSTGTPDHERVRYTEQVIAEIYGRISAVREAGRVVTGIVLPPDVYRSVQAYRAERGEVSAGLPDYLGKYELFGVPIYTDAGDRIVIKARSGDE